MNDSSSQTVVTLLRARARQRPGQTAYTFLAGGGSTPGTATYAEIDRRARQVAAQLVAAGARGERVMLLYPPGLDYITAFYGCLYASAVAVPAYPPDPARLDRSLPRLVAQARDCRPLVVLTTTEIAEAVPALLASVSELAHVRCLTAGDPDDPDAFDPDAEADPETVAVLQYTSGSTRDPRGVMLTHANLMHNSALIHGAFGTTPLSRAVVWLPPYHDMGLIGGILQPLHGGFPVSLMSPAAFLKDPMSWLRAMSEIRGTVSGGPNFAYDLCVRRTTPEQRATLDLSSWEVAFNGAEPIRPATLRRFAEAFAPAGFRPEAFQPCYGLAEATLMVTGAVPWTSSRSTSFDPSALAEGTAVPAGAGSGRPLVSSGETGPGRTVTIVDPELRTPLPPGRVGEIWVSGPDVAAGYWRRPTETHDVFRARLTSGEGPFLRTGDLGFVHAGELFVSGRRKDIIIIRGRNHYPQDLELTAEGSSPLLRPGCGAAFTLDDDGAGLTIAYELTRAADPATLDVEDVAGRIRAAVARDHEVSVDLVVVLPPGALPKTSSGKIQRALCAAQVRAGELPEVARSALSRAVSAAPTEVDIDRLRHAASAERTGLVLRYVQERVAAAGVAARTDAPLLALGLDSLALLGLQQGIEKDLGVNVGVSELADATDLADVAARLSRRFDTGDATAPVSHGQTALWFLQQMAPDSTAHSIAVALRLHGEFDISAFRHSVEVLIERHDALRTTFPAPEGDPVRRIAATGAAAVHEHPAGPDLVGHLERAHREPFDLATGPLLRMHVFHSDNEETVVLVAAHHIITDFLSMSLLVGELETLYAARVTGAPAALSPVAATYTDFVAAQHGALAGAGGNRLRGYWQEQLRGATPQLRLPAASAPARPAGSTRLRLGPELAGRLRERARAEGVTLSMLLLGAYHLLLHRYTGQDDLLVGMPVAGRGRAKFERLVGYCTNPVVIRSRIEPGSTVRELLSAIRSRVVGALEHQDYPLHLLAGDRGEREPFRAMFVFNRPPVPGSGDAALLMTGHPGLRRPFGPLQAEAVPLPTRDLACDLELTVVDAGPELYAELRYRGSVLDDRAGAAMMRQWRRALAELADHTGQTVDGVVLMDDTERQAVLELGNGAVEPFSVADGPARRFAAQAAATPDAIAVESGAERYSYRRLDEEANRLARLLRARGLGGARVGVYLDRSPRLIVTLLAALKAGATYLPVDSAHPRGRVADVFADAGVTVAVCERKLADKLPSAVDALLVDHLPADEDGPVGEPSPDAAPFVIYTSGSTGTPKGVEIDPASLANYVGHAVRHFGLGPADRVLQFASPAFDASAEEIFATLTCGATLVLRNDWMLSSPRAFLEQCGTWGITVLDLPTAYWHDLAAGIAAGEASLPASVRLVIIGGEAVRADRLAAWQRHVGDRARLVNTYGPTETTIVATMQDLTHVDPHGEIPIGTPVANVRAYVLDREQQPVPAGAVGELHLSGAGVARGYLNHDELTRQRFLPDPFGGGRMYRTGDLARWLPDGTLAFLGRADRQVKVNGYRVEPGEIEAVLCTLSEVADALVVPYRSGRLACYLVAAAGHRVDSMRLRTLLGERLPGYLVPAVFVEIGALPRSASGKIDTAALPEPAEQPEKISVAPAAPRNPVEDVVCRSFADVLARSDIGVHDDFFHHGGHSLLATKMIAQLREHFGVDMPLRAVFEHPTPAGLATVIDAAIGPDAAPGLPPVRPVPRTGPLPLTFVQERIWLIQRMNPETTVYNVPRALRIRGVFDHGIVEQVLGELEVRHEILRTTYPEVDGTPVQVTHPPQGLPVRLVDVGDLAEHEREQRIREMILEYGRQPFDLVNGPLIRLTLVRIRPDEHVLIVIEHHLIHDGWAQGVFLRDFLELYEARMVGRSPRLPELPVQYADYAVWQRENLRGAELERLLDFWRSEVDGAPRVLKLPTDRPHPDQLTFAGRLETLIIDAELGAALRRFGREHGATLFMTMAAGFATLVHRYSSQNDMLIGVGMANRQRAETEHLLGMLINTLLLRVGFHPEITFDRLLDQVRERSLRMYAHQDMPFEKLVEDLNPRRSLGRMPLCQVMFSFLDTPMPALEIPGLTFEVVDAHNRTAKFDLNIVVVPRAEQRTGDAEAQLNTEITMLTEYNADVFDVATIRRMHDDYVAILRGAVADAGQRIDAFLPERSAAIPAAPPPMLDEPEIGLPDLDDLDLEDWETEYAPPRTPLEEKLVAIWEQYLPVERVGINDDFFDIGGHSLLANQVISRVQQEFRVELPLRRLFEAPTVALLAVLILEAQAQQVGGDQVAKILAELEG
ncbi:amino acid adenylation domain-containing protein [Plantactinospora sp. GCM10030261]|uniref:amino acid adenylation domain-containing protein n=1 Tax=Plantactinospora sp. GCM10030261 TaxID=3273420 RepID=UPI0036066A8B